MNNDVELLVDARSEVGEGAFWHARRQVLYWVDITAGLLHEFDPSTGKDRVIRIGQMVGTVVPRKSGGLMLGLHHGLASYDLETAKLQIIYNPEAHLPNNRFNDGKCDPAGRFWAGTMNLEAARGAGALYCLDTDLKLRKMLSDISIANGIVWSSDHKTMYYIDSPTYAIRAFDYDIESGDISNRRDVVKFSEADGLPDGMAIDAEGLLWVARFRGSNVARCDPRSGKIVQEIRLPASQVTSCCFGGKNLDVLYITTACYRMDRSKEPHAGALFRANPGVRGVEMFEFGG